MNASVVPTMLLGVWPPTAYKTPSITPPTAAARTVGIGATVVQLSDAGAYAATVFTIPPPPSPPKT